MSKIQKQIDRLKIDIFDILEQQDLLRTQYQRLDNLKKEKLQELYSARQELNRTKKRGPSKGGS